MGYKLAVFTIMKKISIGLLFFVAAFTFSSCCPMVFYQVYETTPITNGLQSGTDVLVYENSDCVVLYNFWADHGNAGFAILNKTDKNIYVDKRESFFVKNGVSNNYYRGFVYTETFGVGMTQAEINSENVDFSKTKSVKEMFLNTNPSIQYGADGESLRFGYSSSFSETRKLSTTSGSVVSSSSHFEKSVSWEEEEVVVIPPQTAKYIKDMAINDVVFRNDVLYLNPTSIIYVKHCEYSEEESPILFHNVISYRVGKEGNEQTINNGFYVSRMTNYPKSEFHGMYSPNKFYVKYKY